MPPTVKPSFVIHRLPAWVINGVTVTMGLALVQCSIGWVAGIQAAQIAIATAVCASLADVVTSVARVARRVGVAVIASTLAATLFLAIRPYSALLIPTVALLVMAAMLLLSWGPKAGSVAFATALSLVFAMSLPASESLSWSRFAWGLAGSLGYWVWAVATARLLQATWRNFALAAAVEGMAGLLAAIARQLADPASVACQSRILDEEAALAERLQNARDLVFDHDEGPQAGRETALLLHLINLRDLAMAGRLGAGLFVEQADEPAARRNAELTGLVIGRVAEALQVVARCLRSGRAPAADTETEHAIQSLVAELERLPPASVQGELQAGASSVLKSKLELLHAIQNAVEPAGTGRDTPDTPLACQRSDLRRYITPDEWRFAAVTANLRHDTPVFRHALRTSITATVAYAVTRAFPWMPHPQWIVLTIVAVMQGNLAQTLLRRNARILGTLSGCLVVALLATSSSNLFLSAAFLVASGIAHAFFGIRYSVTAGAAAVMAVLQAHLVAPDTGFSTLERFGDTVAGAVLGWAATYLLPTWERRSLPGVLDRATEALRAYAAEATALRDDTGGLPRFARQRAYDAIRALSAIRTRSLAEPEDVRVPLPQLTSWLSAAYDLMAHLSNLRLTLTLNAGDRPAPALAAAVAALSQAIEAALGSGPGVSSPAQLSPADERALAAVPHLAWRAHRAMDEARRIAVLSAHIESLIRPSPPALQASTGDNPR